ncbi:11671_t:CDS:2, partial [Acaulospora morrowiae]
LSPFWSNTPTSEWNGEGYFTSAGFQDFKTAQQSLLSQYNLMKKILSGFPCPEHKKYKERAKYWEGVKENIEIRDQQLKLNLLKQISKVPAYKGQTDEQVNYVVNDIIDGTNNDENISNVGRTKSITTITEIEATGYNIQKKRVGIYIMRVLKDGVYLGTEIDNLRYRQFFKGSIS